MTSKSKLNNRTTHAGTGGREDAGPRRHFVAEQVSIGLPRYVPLAAIPAQDADRALGLTIIDNVPGVQYRKSAPATQAVFRWQLLVSLETPIYTGLTLESLVRWFQKFFDRPAGETLYVFFDEIQYLREWEAHLKSLVDI